MEMILHTRIGDYGQTVFEVILPHCKEQHITLTADEDDENRVLEAEWTKDCLKLVVKPFLLKYGFRLQTGDTVLTEADASEVHTDWVDQFDFCDNGSIHYRLYRPNGLGKHPLVLYLHGGGESGTDNRIHLTANLGPAKLAELYPDCYIMAPQTPVDPRKKKTDPNEQFSQKVMYGWTREYLSQVCGIIRDMVDAGLVDPNNIAVTGAARGGGGAILAIAVGNGLFTSAMAVCPRMTPEVTDAMQHLGGCELHFVIPYADHSLERTKYVVEAVLDAKDHGIGNVFLTIYSMDELAKYGVGADPNLTLEERLGQNHQTWIPAYNNERGVLDRLLRR